MALCGSGVINMAIFVIGINTTGAYTLPANFGQLISVECIGAGGIGGKSILGEYNAGGGGGGLF
jgi:hypothetical protein